MDYRKIWTDSDFIDMGWHDAVLYSISLPQADSAIRFDIDYIFKWHWERETVLGWDVAPCTLEFNVVSDLRVSLDWQDQGNTSIVNISRKNNRLSKNGKIMLWDYQIELDVGGISLTSAGFTQNVRKPPIFSISQALHERDDAF